MNKSILFLVCSLLFSCKEYDPIWHEPEYADGSESGGSPEQNEDGPCPYITKVIDYCPAPGQFVNLLPRYESGDKQDDMNRKVLESIGFNNRGMISLGGWGGYVIVGFDHTIENRPGEADFRIFGNSFCQPVSYAGEGVLGGNCEPGIVMVAYDFNKNGVPDDDEWYEIAGSCHRNPSAEPWYSYAQAHGCDMALYPDYSVKYTLSADGQITWRDNKESQGIVEINGYNTQSYFPLWLSCDELTFEGTRLPQNAVDIYGDNRYYVLFAMGWGYADNGTNNTSTTDIDISWAVDRNGNAIELPGADFIKIYTGINQYNAMLGECSTELSGITDL